MRTHSRRTNTASLSTSTRNSLACGIRELRSWSHYTIVLVAFPRCDRTIILAFRVACRPLIAGGIPMPASGICCCPGGSPETYLLILEGIASYQGMGNCQACEGLNDQLLYLGYRGACTWGEFLDYSPCPFSTDVPLFQSGTD